MHAPGRSIEYVSGARPRLPQLIVRSAEKVIGFTPEVDLDLIKSTEAAEE